jgi:hypothetical protein
MKPFVLYESTAMRWLFGGLLNHGTCKIIRHRPAMSLVWYDSELLLGIPDRVGFGAYIDRWLVESRVEVFECLLKSVMILEGRNRSGDLLLLKY